MSARDLVTYGLALAATVTAFGVAVAAARLAWSLRVADLRRLLEDEAHPGDLSKTAVWMHTGYVAATVVLVRACWNVAPGEGLATVLAIYLAFVAGSPLARAWLASRSGAPTNGTPAAPAVAPK